MPPWDCKSTTRAMENHSGSILVISCVFLWLWLSEFLFLESLSIGPTGIKSQGDSAKW